MIEEPIQRMLPIQVITDAVYADVQETVYMNDWWEKGQVRPRCAGSGATLNLPTLGHPDTTTSRVLVQDQEKRKEKSRKEEKKASIGESGKATTVDEVTQSRRRRN